MDMTYEWRNGEVVVHRWKVMPDYSVLAGQSIKQYVGSFPSVEEALVKFPKARASHPMLQPQVQLNHLPGEDDPVPGGMYPDDIDD